MNQNIVGDDREPIWRGFDELMEAIALGEDPQPATDRINEAIEQYKEASNG
tara:strand:- start:3237 stop:3389 length:153 start_codon:yes stop_codon:yes gene_type:complete